MTDSTAVLHGVLADRGSWTATHCPIDSALGVVGTRSAMLLIREAYYGTTRFDDFAERVGLSETVAAARLRELTDAGVLDRRPYREPGQRTRHEYVLTDMGRDLMPVVLGLFEWGGRHLTATGRPPLQLSHEQCGGGLHVEVRCSEGHTVPLDEVAVRARPGRRAGV